MIIRKSTREIEKMAAAGALVAETIAHVGGLLAPGVTTERARRAARPFIREHGGIPTSEGYKGYPKAICISPNDVVVHGIPDGFVVAEGDLVTIDVGVTLDGYIADSAYTFGVGEIEPEAQRLLDVAQDALAAGIAEAVVGQPRGRRLARDPGGRRGRGLLGRAQPRRARRRGRTTTRTRTSRTSASPAAARASRRG